MNFKTTLKRMPKIGNVCLITKYRDRDLNDPWAFGKLVKIELVENNIYYKVEGFERMFKNCFVLKDIEIKNLIELKEYFK